MRGKGLPDGRGLKRAVIRSMVLTAQVVVMVGCLVKLSGIIPDGWWWALFCVSELGQLVLLGWHLRRVLEDVAACLGRTTATDRRLPVRGLSEPGR